MFKRFYDSLKISKFKRISLENHSTVKGWHPYKLSLSFSLAVAVAISEK